MVPLPHVRVKPENRPFTNAVVDYFELLLLLQDRNELKRYGCIFACLANWRDDAVVRACASQSVDLKCFSPSRVIPKDFKKWHSQLPCLALNTKEQFGDQAGQLACCVLGQDT